MIACEMDGCYFFLNDLLEYLRSKVSSAISSSTKKESKWGEDYKRLCVGFVKKVRVDLVLEFCKATQIEGRFHMNDWFNIALDLLNEEKYLNCASWITKFDLREKFSDEQLKKLVLNLVNTNNVDYAQSLADKSLELK